MQGMADIRMHTCVRFVKRSNQKDYIEIRDGRGCSSSVGKIGGKQIITLKRSKNEKYDWSCVYKKGTTIHQMVSLLSITVQF